MTLTEPQQQASLVREFLEAEYQAKTEITTKQYDRILSRFNYFLTIESGLFGVVGFMIHAKLYPVVYALCVVGLFSAALWCLTGTADRMLVVTYRSDAAIAYVLFLRSLLQSRGMGADTKDDIEEPLRNTLQLYNRELGTPGVSPGSAQLKYTRRDIEKGRILLARGDVHGRADLIGGRFRFSATRMPIWASLGTAVIWLGALLLRAIGAF